MGGTSGRLAGRRALVTGAGTGIGEATALLLAREGAAVGLVGRRQAMLEAVAERIRALGGDALPLPADVSQESQVEASVQACVERWGGLDACVAVAGIELYDQGDDRVDRLSTEIWRQIIDINLTGMFFTLKHVVRAMRAVGGGSIVVTGSPTGLYGLARGETAYSAAKAGCHGLARVVASDVAKDGIRVNIVVPGFIDTPINERFIRERPDDVKAYEASIPLHRAGRSEEVAAMNVWLCTDEASYCTGGYFVVDGGLTAV
jgi:3-oxoacyl-[acyl-carrier protein] reductase